MENKPSVRVLVVDDEELTRQVTERAFRKGYDVTAAYNGHQALSRMEQSPRPFDLYVPDMMMPAMRGTELAARIRQQQPDAKILYLTGYSDNLFSPGRSVLPGDEAFLDKPASLKALLSSRQAQLWREHARATGSIFFRASNNSARPSICACTRDC